MLTAAGKIKMQLNTDYHSNNSAILLFQHTFDKDHFSTLTFKEKFHFLLHLIILFTKDQFSKMTLQENIYLSVQSLIINIIII